MGSPLVRAESALEAGADSREVLQRFGRETVDDQSLPELLVLLEDHDPGYGAAAVGRWAANLVADGWLVPRGRHGE